MSEVEVFIKQNIWVLYGVFLWILIMVVGYSWYKRRGKIKVRIQTPLGETTKWIKPEPEGDKLIIEKPKGKNKPGWIATFSNQSIILVKDWLGRTVKVVEIFYNSPEAIKKDYDLKSEEQPKWSKEQSKKFIEAEGLKKAGEPEEGKSNLGLWILGALIILDMILHYLLATGRIRIG